MDADRWSRTERLFHEALALAPAERAAFLDHTCGDADLRAEVLALLAAYDTDGPLAGRLPVTALLDDLDLPLPDGVALAAPRDLTGARVGPYRLVREVGRGGMGTVYLADRADGDFRQRVALKLVRPDLPAAAKEGARVRFLRERDLLAGLEHPGIARLLGGGETDAGDPYVTMEFVAGRPVTDHADARRLPVPDRIALFLEVCDAVAYAHRRLVVHRDLKPSNVFVAEDEAGAPRVKLLDFGIAKLLDHGEHTVVGGRAFTPDCAAPEQVAGGAVGTAADVWALGVLLHRLLAGRRPFPPASWAPGDTGRRAEPPSVAATRPGRDGELAPEAIAADRQTTPDRLRRALAGDLDAVVARCLRPEPDARYPSADALADDLRRHLAGAPVAARRGGRRYVLGRFVRRRRWGVAAAGVAVVGAALFVGALVRERDRAAAEAARAQATADFLESLFLAVDPATGHGGTFTVREALDAGAARVGTLAHEPAAHAHLLDVFGRVYRALGAHDRAEALHREAVAVARREFGPTAPATLTLEHHYAYLLSQMGRDREAEARFRRVLEARRWRDDPDGVVESLADLAGHLVHTDAYGQVPALVAEGLTVLDRHPEAGPPGQNGAVARAGLTYLLAQVAGRERRWAEAERLTRDALAAYRAAFSAEHVYVASVESGLAGVLMEAGRADEALPLARHAHAVYLREWGPEHPWTQSTDRLLADLTATSAVQGGP